MIQCEDITLDDQSFGKSKHLTVMINNFNSIRDVSKKINRFHQLQTRIVGTMLPIGSIWSLGIMEAQLRTYLKPHGHPDTIVLTDYPPHSPHYAKRRFSLSAKRGSN